MKSLAWRTLPLLIWVIAVIALGQQLTVPTATLAGIAGCACAFWIGARLAASRIRLWVPWACALPCQAFVAALSEAVRGTDAVAAAVGPSGAWTLSAMVLWFGSAALWVGLFQATSRRLPPFVAVEAALVSLVGAAIFAQHREGFLNRPFFLVDPLWAQGYDPQPYFLAIGAVIAAVLVLLMASKSAASSRRSHVLDVALLVIMLLAMYTLFPTREIKHLRDLQSGGQSSDKKSDASPSPPPPRQPGGGQSSGSPEEASASRDGGSNGADMRDEDFSRKKDAAKHAQPVAVVLLHDDYTPPDGFYYFRQTVFSLYNGQRLVRDQGQHDLDVADAFPAERPITVSSAAPPAGVERRIETTVAIITSHPRPFGLVSPTEFRAADNPDVSHFERAYEVTSNVLTRGLPEMLDRSVGDPRWTPETLKHYLSAPTDPRYQQLASLCVEKLRREFRDKPLARAIAVKLWLDQNGTYDLTSKYEHSADPVGDFLFGDRVGYCVSFAHAAAALYRTVGVPSRVGTGYAVDARFRGQGSSILIRSNASHAWPEIYLTDIGWVPLDISPAKSLVKPAEMPDSGQQDLFGGLARKKGQRRQPDRSPLANGDLQEMVRRVIVAALRSVALGLGLLLVALYGMKIWRRLEPRFAPDSRLPLVAYRSALSVLADHGYVRRHGESREAFARELTSTSPSLAPLTRLHLEQALGQGHAVPARDASVALYEAVTREVASGSTLRRRLLALIHPLGWWFVR